MPSVVALATDHFPDSSGGLADGAARRAREAGVTLRLVSAEGRGAAAAIAASDADGVVAKSPSPQFSRDLLRRCRDVGRPVVFAAPWDNHDPGGEHVLPDEPTIGRLAARHLLDLGHRRLAFVGVASPWSDGRAEGFADAARAAGATVEVEAFADHPAASDAERLVPWLRRLAADGPVGLCGCDDMVALAAVAAARSLGLRVPADVAAVGVNDDPLRCDLAEVPLTSVDRDLPAIGRLAVSRLLERLAGDAERAGDGRAMTVPPRGVTARASTDWLAFADPDVALAVATIRRRACEPGFSVADVLRAVPMARRRLERRVRDALGRSPAEEVRRVRVEAARELVETTALPLAAVARRCGFTDAAHLSRHFARAHGRPPGRHRAATSA